MAHIGRNDPCPCGSGKKYKKCCLAKEQETASRRHSRATAVPRALEWLVEHFPDQLRERMETGFFGGLGEEDRQALEELPAVLADLLRQNLGEWLLAEAWLEFKGESRSTMEVVLGPGGPLFSAEGRDWLERLAENPLSLFEVRQVNLEEGLLLADLLRPEVPPIWVREKAATRSLVKWDVFGARLVREADGFVLSGAVYPLPREHALACKEEIFRQVKRKGLDSERGRAVCGVAIPAFWQESLLAELEREIPRLVDAGTGEPLLLVTDYFRVADWDALGRNLAAQPDVEGDRREGWDRFEELTGDQRRSLTGLSPGKSDTLEVFSRSLTRADQARAWLEKVAGAAVKHKTREIIDPRSSKALDSEASKPAKPLPPEMEARLLAEFMQRHYENWTDEPIPALGNKTPRQAVRSAKGRAAVIELLKHYEQSEARRAKDQGSEPFDFGFLWERLGLERET